MIIDLSRGRVVPIRLHRVGTIVGNLGRNRSVRYSVVGIRNANSTALLVTNSTVAICGHVRNDCRALPSISTPQKWSRVKCLVRNVNISDELYDTAGISLFDVTARLAVASPISLENGKFRTEIRVCRRQLL